MTAARAATRGAGTSTRRPRIVFMNRSYWPDAEATGQLLTDLCEDLAEECDVTAIVGQPNQNPRDETFVRSGREQRHGVTIERVRHPRFSKRSLPGRAVNLVGFLAAAVFRAVRVRSPDVFVIETDPFLLSLAGPWLKWWHRARLVVYLQDIYPDIAVALGKVREGWLTGLIRRRLLAAYRHADRIVVLGEDMKAKLTAWGLPAESIVSIPNWVDTRWVFPVKENNAFRREHNLDGKFVVMHSGNTGLSQCLENVLEAAAQLHDRPDIEFLMVGDGAAKPSLEQQAKRLQLSNVRFLPYQPRDALAESLSAADLHLISMHPAVGQCLMPSKFYGILASGTAVLAIAPASSELATIIQDEEVGFTVESGSPGLLADKLRWCADNREELADRGRLARGLAEREYDRRQMTDRFAELLRGVLPQAVQAKEVEPMETEPEDPLESAPVTPEVTVNS